jgi:pyruvate dehydrogenase E2 component (dihydrolipoamide acetyltransferase)
MRVGDEVTPGEGQVTVVMPRLSDSMQDGTVLRWLKHDLDEVRRGEEIVEIETDKATMPYEADADGILHIVAAEGQIVAVGARIAWILPPGASPPADDAAAPEPSSARGGEVNASPVARRIARERGIDLAEIVGSGPGGRIVKADVEGDRVGGAAATVGDAAAPEPVAASTDANVQELTRLQRAVAARMAESKASAPEFALEVEVDMSACVELRSQLAELADPVPSYNDIVVKAVGVALREFPRVNGSYRDGRWELHPRVNVGIAVAGDAALVVPTIIDADQKPLGVLARETAQLIAKVRDGAITEPELSGGTFTVSNLGMFGIDRFTAIINPPQAAILAIGALKRKPIALESGAIVAREMMTVTLVCDHRILYGADGARFLARLRQLLERPAWLVL